MPPSFRALASRNFRIFLAGQGIGLIGTWGQRIAMIWLVYRTTGSPLLLGIAAFAAEIPFLFILPFGGVIADRVDRRRALMVVQVISAVQAFAMGALAWADLTPYPVILTLAVILGVCQSIEGPLRQAMFPELLREPRDLPNAIAMMAFMNNAGRLIGPLVAGLMIGAVGEKACFLLNGGGYLLVLVALWQLRLSRRAARDDRGSIAADLREGLRYAWQFLPIRGTLCLLAAISFCGLPYLVVVPVFTREVLHADARALGYLLSAAAAGAAVGLVLLAARVRLHALPRLLAAAAATTAGAMLVLSLLDSFWPAIVAMAFVGLGIVLTATSSNILVQSIAAVDKRGRVLGLFSTVFFGIAPIGSVVAGSLAEALGCQAAFALLGAILVLCALVFERNRKRIEARIPR